MIVPQQLLVVTPQSINLSVPIPAGQSQVTKTLAASWAVQNTGGLAGTVRLSLLDIGGTTLANSADTAVPAGGQATPGLSLGLTFVAGTYQYTLAMRQILAGGATQQIAAQIFTIAVTAAPAPAAVGVVGDPTVTLS